MTAPIGIAQNSIAECVDQAAVGIEREAAGEKSIEVICLARIAALLARKLDSHGKRGVRFRGLSTSDRSHKHVKEWFRSVVKTTVISTNVFSLLRASGFDGIDNFSHYAPFLIGALRGAVDCTNHHVSAAMICFHRTDRTLFQSLENKSEILSNSIRYRDAILDFLGKCQQATESLTHFSEELSAAQQIETLKLVIEALEAVITAQNLYRPPVDIDKMRLSNSRTPIENCIQDRGSELIGLYQQREGSVADVVSELNETIQQLVMQFRAGPKPHFEEKELDPKAQEIVRELSNVLSAEIRDGMHFKIVQSLAQIVSLGIYLNRQWKEKDVSDLKQSDLASDPTLFSMLMLIIKLIELRRDIEVVLVDESTSGSSRTALSEGAGRIHDGILAFVNQALPEKGVTQLFSLIDADFGLGQANLQSMIEDAFKRDPLFSDA